jgi:Glyoxalase-like domain
MPGGATRLRDLGAREERTVTVADEWAWTVMTDPDGNEFCVTDP